MELTAKEMTKLLKPHQEQMDKVSEAICAADFREIRNVYMDLSLIKDTKLGTLIAFCPDKKTLNYLIENLPQYNKRLLRDTIRATYQDYPLGELDLNMRMHNPEYSELIFNVSPDTVFSGYLIPFLGIIQDNNNKCEYPDPVGLDINTWPLSETPMMRTFKQIIEHHCPHFQITFLNKDPMKFSTGMWHRYQTLILDNLPYLVEEGGSFYQPLFENKEFVGTHIYAPYQTTKEKIEEFEKNGADLNNERHVFELFRYTAALLSLWCNFRYMDFSIPVPDEGGS